MVMLAKGNRSPQVTQARKTHGGFYLGSIGGPAARLAKDRVSQWTTVSPCHCAGNYIVVVLER